MIGEEGDVREDVWRNAVCGLEAQVPLVPVEDMLSSVFLSFGTIDCGLELMSRAWKTMTHGFSVRRSGDELPTPDRAAHVLVGPHRVHDGLLIEHPVDLLVVGYSHLSRPLGPHDTQPVEKMVAPAPRRPRVILETWWPKAQVWRWGPVSKPATSRWNALGYTTRCRRMSATRYGGAMIQDRLVVLRVATDLPVWEWPPEESAAEVVRAMSNLLTPAGLLKTGYLEEDTIRCPIPNAESEPMPATVGSLIRTERGVRRLQVDEVYRGLGSQTKDFTPSRNILARTTSAFLFEALSFSLLRLSSRCLVDPMEPGLLSGRPRPFVLEQGPLIQRMPLFEWSPPDLSEGGPWCQARLARLKWAASKTYPLDSARADELIREGQRILNIHRGNYSASGPEPRHLQIIWWEFPEEHWTALREGSRMNFLRPPDPGAHDNARMDDEQLAVAVEFVEELLDLRVLRCPESGEVVANAPLFLVPKEGQVGQWRVIADMLRGGQNASIGGDPVFLPRLTHILEQMYDGGWSAVVDASKYFYQFMTHPDDRPFLGIRHPATKALYTYFGLPMGSANSPALGGRYGVAFLRRLRSTFSIFTGDPTPNCFWTSFDEGVGGSYQPGLGYGMTFLTRGGAAVLVWAFVDDFLVHAPTEELCTEALRHFLDVSVICGLLCHPKKLTPPSQRVRYCGFELDSKGIPSLHIPVAKRERALAMVEYIVCSRLDKLFSRLSLAVVAGVLQSLVEGTPERVGHTRLRAFHSVVHPAGLGSGAEPYFTTCTVPEGVREDLRWWITFLRHGGSRASRMTHSATLIPTWGDGSGTGTGGTYTLPDRPLKMWKGKWSPFVYQFSSNWKELYTLLLTLQQVAEEDPASVRHTTLFYFTDNSATYWIASSGSIGSPSLHRLITEIKRLVFLLDCRLQVVHVPGYLMIAQGTDGLSRGLWMRSYHGLMSEAALLAGIFAPLPFCPELTGDILARLPSHGFRAPPSWYHHDWASPWNPSRVFDTCSVWFPPPEAARQCITFVLNAFIERPLTTSALFVVPRVLQAFWWGISRYVREVETLYPHVTPLRLPPRVPIPVVVLYIQPHERCLSPSPLRLEFLPRGRHQRWHAHQAALVRGLPPAPVDQ